MTSAVPVFFKALVDYFGRKQVQSILEEAYEARKSSPRSKMRRSLDEMVCHLAVSHGGSKAAVPKSKSTKDVSIALLAHLSAPSGGGATLLELLLDFWLEGRRRDEKEVRAKLAEAEIQITYRTPRAYSGDTIEASQLTSLIASCDSTARPIDIAFMSAVLTGRIPNGTFDQILPSMEHGAVPSGLRATSKRPLLPAATTRSETSASTIDRTPQLPLDNPIRTNHEESVTRSEAEICTSSAEKPDEVDGFSPDSPFPSFLLTLGDLDRPWWQIDDEGFEAECQHFLNRVRLRRRDLIARFALEAKLHNSLTELKAAFDAQLTRLGGGWLLRFTSTDFPLQNRTEVGFALSALIEHVQEHDSLVRTPVPNDPLQAARHRRTITTVESSIAGLLENIAERLDSQDSAPESGTISKPCSALERREPPGLLHLKATEEAGTQLSEITDHQIPLLPDAAGPAQQNVPIKPIDQTTIAFDGDSIDLLDTLEITPTEQASPRKNASSTLEKCDLSSTLATETLVAPVPMDLQVETAPPRRPIEDSDDLPLVCSLLDKGQLEAVYTLLKSEASVDETSLAVIRVLIGSKLIERETDEVASEIEAELLSLDTNLSPCERLLMTASALRIAFRSPQSVLPEHLEMPEGVPAFSSFIHEIANYFASHRTLSAEEVRQAGDYLALQVEEDKRIAEFMKWWPTTHDDKQSDIADLWRLLREEKIEDDVTACLQRQLTEDHLDESPWAISTPDRLKEYCRRFHGAATSAFGYKRILTHIQTTAQHVRSCLQATSARQASERSLGRNAKDLALLRSRITAFIPTLEADLERSSTIGTKLFRPSLMIVAGEIREVLTDFLRLPISHTVVPQARYNHRATQPIADAVDQHLLLFPELPFDSNHQVILRSYRECLLKRPLEDREPIQICREWIRKGAYDNARIMIRSFSSEVSTLLSAEIDSSMATARAALTQRVNELRYQLEARYLDDSITEFDRSLLEHEISTIAPEHVRNFPAQQTSLDRIREKLAAAEDLTRQRLRLRWHDAQPTLEQIGADESEKHQFRSRIESSLEGGRFRAVEELLFLLCKVAEEGGRLASILSSNETVGQLEEFLQNFAALDDLATKQNRLIEAEVGEGGKELFKAWSELKSRGSASVDSLTTPLSKVLTLLGFTLNESPKPAPRPEGFGGGTVCARIPVSLDSFDAAPFWQFGSKAKETTVLLAWPSDYRMLTTERIIRQILERKLLVTGGGLLVMYFGRLSLERRLLRPDTQSGEIDLPIALVDDILMLHLAKTQHSRPSTLLRCSLPFASPNPYVAAGPVPREMFFGRAAQIAALQKETGGQSIVYGGRQLGKSALLEQVQRDFSDPRNGRHAWVRDIKANFAPDGEGDPEDLWRTLLDDFRSNGLIPPHSVSRPETMQRYLLESVAKEHGRSVLVLLDEADRFLDTDNKKGFRVVSALRELVRNSEGRLRFVFAGLSTVARFQGTPNNPLVQFGEPLCVGPLTPTDAVSLVTTPLHACGFRFEREEDPLLILAFTNYHTKLTQFFCRELVKRMHSRPSRVLPPYIITRRDIETISQIKSVSDELRKIFEATIAVDYENRYRAVVLSLAVDQMEPEHDNGYNKSYSPADIVSQVGKWWPAAFEQGSYSHGELQCLLVEMCGMGLLLRDRNSKYRLRSPNLVRLLGDKAAIEAQLIELPNKLVKPLAGSECAHAPIMTENRYSCLTYWQERGVRQADSGFILAIGSNANGLENIKDALIRSGADEGMPCLEAPDDTSSPAGLRSWLNRQIPVLQNAGAATLVYRLASHDPKLVNFVQEGFEFCKKQHGPKRRLRLVYVINPRTLWDWLNLPPSLRERIEEQCGFVLELSRWNNGGIRQRFLDAEAPVDESIVKSVMSATGGWDLLVGHYFEQFGETRDATKSLAAFGDSWEHGGLKKSLWRALGLAGFELGISAIRDFLQWGSAETSHSRPADISFSWLRRLDYIANVENNKYHLESRLLEAFQENA